MTIQVLACRADGTQVLEAQEVPENYFEAANTAASDTGQREAE